MENHEELRAISEVSRRLQEKFPHVRPESVDAVVATVHQQYDGRPIRDFVPVLVERDAAARLASPVHARSHASA